jgi:hypothetical protein
MHFFIVAFLLFGSVWAKDFIPFLSFSASKSELIKLYSQHRVLPLSGYTYRFDEESCSVSGFVDGVSSEPERVLWRYLVPEKMMGQGMKCMQERLCKSTLSHRYLKGPICCRRISKAFKNMSSDLHNIIPTVLKEEQDDLIELKSIADKGSIARIYLYMIKQYGLKIEKKLLNRVKKWHELYPVSAWEKQLNRKIFQLQGTFNPYIEKL